MGYSQEDLDRCDEHAAEAPPILELFMMCNDLGIEKDDHRTVSIEGAWEYYKEIKALWDKKFPDGVLE